MALANCPLYLALGLVSALAQDHPPTNVQGIVLPDLPVLSVTIPSAAIDWNVAVQPATQSQRFLYLLGARPGNTACASCPEQRHLVDLSVAAVRAGAGTYDLSPVQEALHIGVVASLRPDQTLIIRTGSAERTLRLSEANGWNQLSSRKSPEKNAQTLAQFVSNLVMPLSRGATSQSADGLVLRDGAYYVAPPRIKANVIRLSMPRLAAPPRQETRLLLVVEIDPSGRARVINSTPAGDAALRAAASQAVSEWEFRPIVRDSAPVTVRMPAEFVFRPDGGIRVTGL